MVSRRVVCGTIGAVAAMAGSFLPLGAPAASAQPAPDFEQTWEAGPFVMDQGQPIAESSPMVATLDGAGPSVVVGDRSGYLYAYHLADGQPVPGWPVYNGGAPIDSTPSVLRGANGLDTVLVGSGDAQFPFVGGYDAYRPNGSHLWHAGVHPPPEDPLPITGVSASLTVTSLQGGADAFAASLDQEAYALNAQNGRTLTGWPFFTADSTFSTAAAADLYGTGHTQLVVGGASTAGYALGQTYGSGGHLRIFNGRGGLICHYDSNQEIDSSPAVGPLLAGGGIGIAVGTGSFYAGRSQTDTLLVFNNSCDLMWSDRLDGVTASSPALADVEGNGNMQIVEGTDNGSNSGTGGSVWVLDGASGHVIWRQPVYGRVIGSVVTADLTGQGYQDILVPTTQGVAVLDGRTHQEVTRLGTGFGFQSAPLVTDDPNGTVGVTIAGYNGSNEGVIFHYELSGSNGAAAVGAGSWPMFHHDPQLTGTDGPRPSGTLCTAAAAADPGYNLVASDGGVFSFTHGFCGSTGGIRLARPIVGMAMSTGRGGYWLVASDGGVFTFGGAHFYGSTGAVHLAKPIVGMAATRDGKGYWLVASDGGVFAFGDARFYGSTGAVHLAKPIVGMSASPSGLGYSLVATDGGVFTFGDAAYCGSTGRVHLAKPVVGLAYNRATGCYWLVGSDGGVFAFGSPYYGGLGKIRLARPIVGITPTLDGRGYWLVASDGGVFAFGDARYYGSTGGIRLARPVLGLEGFY
jgi:hypothetical protein